MKFFGRLVGILCLLCGHIQSEANTASCLGASPISRRSKFIDSVYDNKYWTVKRTGNTRYQNHPLGANIDTLVKFSTGFLLSVFFHDIDNYYNERNLPGNDSIIKHEKYTHLQMDDNMIIYKTNHKHSKLHSQKFESRSNSRSYMRPDIPIFSEYRFALINQTNDGEVLVFQSCSVDEPDTWYLIREKILRREIGPDGTLNAKIEGIHVDHMPKLLFHPLGLV